MLTPRSWAEEVLASDCPLNDLTTDGLGIAGRRGTVTATLKAPGIAAALDLGRALFECAGAEVRVHAAEGARVGAGEPLLVASGSAASLHAAYKTVQCVMEYAGGIAERTRLMVDAARAERPGVVVAGTRKHFPGGKRIALAGLHAGGGTAHRLGLSDSILVFDQHREFVDDLPRALAELKARNPERRVAVEAAEVGEALEYLAMGADILQCERFTPEDVARLAEAARAERPDVRIAVAGGVTGENAAAYARAGADILVTSWPYWGRPRDVKMTFRAE